MWSEGDVVKAREIYLTKRLPNLLFLLQKRFGWMNLWIPKEATTVVELGCGMGASKEFISHPGLIMTDFADHPWVDKNIDALNMDFPDASLDILIANNIIHHLAFPKKFFREANRVLKPGGRILIQEINASLLMRIILRAMRHEGFSYRKDVHSETEPCNDPSDLWSANCAIPNLLFDNKNKFETKIPQFKIEYRKYTEFLLFPLSGGVIAKSPTVPLPFSILKLIDKLDGLFVNTMPSIFSLQRRIVLKKI